jgi:hypothetical protein
MRLLEIGRVARHHGQPVAQAGGGDDQVGLREGVSDAAPFIDHDDGVTAMQRHMLRAWRTSSLKRALASWRGQEAALWAVVPGFGMVKLVMLTRLCKRLKECNAAVFLHTSLWVAATK